MKMMENDTGPVPRRYSDAGSVERLVGVRASRYASGRPSLRRAGESGAGGLPPRQSHFAKAESTHKKIMNYVLDSRKEGHFFSFFAVMT
mgnify:CR=1 FL=1